MKKLLPLLIFTLSALTILAQNDISQYLKTHHYPFSLEKGFDQQTADTLKQKFKNYKLVLQAEGGSHYLNIYDKLPLMWIKFLYENFDMTHFFLEGGHTSDILLNKYLETGDTSYIFTADKTFWKSLYSYNLNLPSTKKLKYFGIDFESRKTYVKALQLILPLKTPPVDIQPSIALIKNANDTLLDCDYIININKELKAALLKWKEQFVEYFDKRYDDFERIILNKGNCHDVFNNRNKNMASNFLSFDKDFNKAIYYGELGEAHTVLTNKNTASTINNSTGFKDSVCVINLYCYNCTTPEEEVSNWPLKKIDKDIVTYFLPYCTSDFTLFDLSGNDEAVKKYKAHGQFLIIVKNQN